MKLIKSIALLLVFIGNGFYQSYGQQPSIPNKIVSISFGSSMSNLLNSEAPNKLYAPEGANISSTSSVSNIDYSSKIVDDIKYGIHLGLTFEYRIKPRTMLKFSFNYEQKGMNMEYNEVSPSGIGTLEETFNRKVRNNYITLPVVLKNYIGEKGFYIYGGIYSGILVHSEIYGLNRTVYQDDQILNFPNNIGGGSVGTYSESWFSLTTQEEDKEYTNRVDVGITAGMGYSRYLNKGWVYALDLSISQGLVKVDRLYDNEYESVELSGSSGFINNTTSSNYLGLNSRAKNINAVLSFSLGKRSYKTKNTL